MMDELPDGSLAQKKGPPTFAPKVQNTDRQDWYIYFKGTSGGPRCTIPHSPEEVASGPRILCWVMFFHFLSLTSLNGLVL